MYALAEFNLPNNRSRRRSKIHESLVLEHPLSIGIFHRISSMSESHHNFLLLGSIYRMLAALIAARRCTRAWCSSSMILLSQSELASHFSIDERASSHHNATSSSFDFLNLPMTAALRSSPLEDTRVWCSIILSLSELAGITFHRGARVVSTTILLHLELKAPNRGRSHRRSKIATSARARWWCSSIT